MGAATVLLLSVCPALFAISLSTGLLRYEEVSGATALPAEFASHSVAGSALACAKLCSQGQGPAPKVGKLYKPLYEAADWCSLPPERNWWGHELVAFQDIPGDVLEAECRSRCASEPACRVFIFLGPDSNAATGCHLKWIDPQQTVSRYVRQNSATTTVVKCPNACVYRDNHNYWALGTGDADLPFDYHNQAATKSWTQNHNQCQALCALHPQCTVAAYHKPTGDCYLKPYTVDDLAGWPSANQAADNDFTILLPLHCPASTPHNP